MSKNKNLQRKANNKTSNTKNTYNKFNLFKIAAITLSALAVLVIATVLIIGNSKNDAKIRDTGNQAVVKDTDLVIQKSEITNIAKFYPVNIKGTKLEVLAVKASDGSIRTAFNTCQVCFSSGRGYYLQEGNALICQNCGNRFGTDDVEVTRGGCNPVPITADGKTETETDITISKEFLNEYMEIFANWKY